MNNLRPENEVFQEIEALCTSSGYIHAIAFLCYRDNIIHYDEEGLKPEDIAHMFSHDRLLRTEISTIIGLMLKKDIDFTIPLPDVLQKYIDKTDKLMEELHKAMMAPANTIFIDIIKNKKEVFFRSFIEN